VRVLGRGAHVHQHHGELASSLGGTVMAERLHGGIDTFEQQAEVIGKGTRVDVSARVSAGVVLGESLRRARTTF